MDDHLTDLCDTPLRPGCSPQALQIEFSRKGACRSAAGNLKKDANDYLPGCNFPLPCHNTHVGHLIRAEFPRDRVHYQTKRRRRQPAALVALPTLGCSDVVGEPLRVFPRVLSPVNNPTAIALVHRVETLIVEDHAGLTEDRHHRFRPFAAEPVECVHPEARNLPVQYSGHGRVVLGALYVRPGGEVFFPNLANAVTVFSRPCATTVLLRTDGQRALALADYLRLT